MSILCLLKCLQEDNESFPVRRKRMFHKLTVVFLVYQYRMIETSRMLAYRLLVGVKPFNDSLERDAFVHRHMKQYLYAVMVRHTLEVPLHLLCCLQFSHSLIIHHTNILQYVGMLFRTIDPIFYSSDPNRFLKNFVASFHATLLNTCRINEFQERFFLLGSYCFEKEGHNIAHSRVVNVVLAGIFQMLFSELLVAAHTEIALELRHTLRKFGSGEKILVEELFRILISHQCPFLFSMVTEIIIHRVLHHTLIERSPEKLPHLLPLVRPPPIPLFFFFFVCP